MGSMTLLGCGRVAAAAASFTTWDPANTASELIPLSNGNLTVTGSTTDQRGTRSIASHSAGKYYHEVALNGGGFYTVGFCNSSYLMNGGSGLPGLDGSSNSIGIDASGNYWRAASPTGSFTGWSANDVNGFAIDFTNSLLWVKNITTGGNWNNNGSANPATGVGGVSITGISSGPYFVTVFVVAIGGTHTANFGATTYALAGGAPSGFGNW